MMKKVIIYIGGFELPDKNAAAHRVLSNAKILREIGYEVIFVDVDRDRKESGDILSTKRIIQGFESFSVPYPRDACSWFSFLTSIKQYVTVIEQYKNVYMLIMYNLQSIVMHKMIRYCYESKIMCVGDITEWRSAKGEKIYYQLIKDMDTWYRMKVLNRKLNGIIVISKYLRNYYQGCKNVILIPALVDATEKKWNNQYKKSRNKLLLVYAGNPGFKDRIDILIQALRLTKRNYRLDIIGITEEEYLRISPHHKEFLQDERIVFHGRVSHLEALDYVKKANYSCFFRNKDRVSDAGFPTKLSEATTCGTPIITNDTGDIKDYLIDGLNGYVIENVSVKKLAERLENAVFEMEIDTSMFDYRRYRDIFQCFFNGITSK